MERDRVSRRDFLRRSTAVGAGVLVTGLAASRAGAAGQLVITDPGGEWQNAAAAAYYKGFEKETGVKVLYSARPSLALGRLKAMVEARNVEWDVTILADYLMYRAAKDGLIEQLPKSIDTTNVIESAVLPFGLGNDIYATVMAYSTKKWPAGQGPKTWADFWDVKRFPGRRSMAGIGYGPLEFALLADGVPLDKLYPLDVNRALKKMNEIKPHITVWWTAGAQQAQLMSNDEVDLIQGWNGRFQSAIDQKAPFVIEWNQGIYQMEGWVVPKGAPNRDVAMKFLNFTLRPELQAEFAKHLPYGPVNRKALALVPPERAKELPTFEANLTKMTVVDAQWVAENADALQAKWTEWKVK